MYLLSPITMAADGALMIPMTAGGVGWAIGLNDQNSRPFSRGGETSLAGPLATTVARRVRREHPGGEGVVYDGGQPYWPLILGVE